MSTLWQDIQYKMLKADSRINLLIGINVVVFVLINIPGINTFISNYLLLAADWQTLVKQLWSPLTYMFIHTGFFQILFNMLWFYWIGQIFEEYLNHKRLLGLYIAGGLAGAFFFIATYNLLNLANVEFAAGSIAGASVSVMAIVVATATLLPDTEISLIIIGAVKLKWVCVIYIAFALFGAQGNPGVEAALVGAGLFGFVYIKQLQRGNDWIGGINKLFSKGPAMKVVNNTTHSHAQRKPSGIPRQDEVDRILDKISSKGYDSLSKQEKEILFRASNNNES